MATVTLKKLEKRYGATPVVHGIDLEVADREFIALVGPSGCGKSTLLRTIAGLEEASEGTIEIGGEVVNDFRPRDRDVAMVFQDYALYPHMSVARNIGFGLKARGMPKAEVEARVAEAARMLGITPLLDRYPRQLSGGQRQRVAIARALVNNPSILLADEPTGNLDSKTGVEIMALFARLHHAGSTVILVTHEADIAAYAHRVIAIRDGQVERDVRQEPHPTLAAH